MRAARHRFRILLAAALAAACATVAAPGSAAPVFFLVAEFPGSEVHGDSYVLPLEDPTAIAHARALIDQGPAAGETIVFARIAAGADGVNRDWRAPGRPEWSWHVTEFEGFGDFGIEILDGWPSFVEEDVVGWIENTDGRVGFWSYTVVAELPVREPAALGALGAALAAVAGGRTISRRAAR